MRGVVTDIQPSNRKEYAEVWKNRRAEILALCPRLEILEAQKAYPRLESIENNWVWLE